MKIKVPNLLLAINILDVLLAGSMFLVHLAPVRFILGLPFLLFFPGYAVLKALFVNKKEISTLETIGISGAVSIAVAGLIGFMLNYTKWGIRPEPAVGFMGGFILVASLIAFIRQAKLHGGVNWLIELKFDLPFRKVPANKMAGYMALSLILVAAIAVVAYVAVDIRAKDTFTEFYVLGLNDKAENYPTVFTIESGNVTHVSYADGNKTSNKLGEVYLDIVNHESLNKYYSLNITVDGKPEEFYYGGSAIPQLGNIQLKPGEKWEGEVGFAPSHTGSNQQVDFLLFKDGGTNPEASLRLWIDVVASTP